MLNQKICREHASKCIESSEPLLHLFQQWLIAFEKTQSATRDEEPVAAVALSRIEFAHRNDTGRRAAWSRGEAWARSLPAGTCRHGK